MIAALYDIHGNLPALEAVLDEIVALKVARILVGGDVCPGPLAPESLDVLLNAGIPVDFIRGNGDRDTLALRRGETIDVPEAYVDTMRWCAERLRSDHERLIAGWPATFRVQSPTHGSILFCHATPRNDVDIFTRLTPEDRLVPLFQSVDADLVICGHTHMQFDRRIGGVRVVNAGSLGMPFGEPGAHWLLLGSRVEFRRTVYDLEKAAERIRASGYPQAEQFVTENVLHPPSEEQMVEKFTRAGIH